MKSKLLISICLGFLISLLPLLNRPAIANTPPVLRPCLEKDSLFLKPRQYRELAKAKRGEDTYYYIKEIYSKIQPTQTLIKVKASKCDVLFRNQTFLPSLTKYLPLSTALSFAEARWRYDLSTPFGAEVVKSFSRKSSPTLENGEMLEPLVLPREDFIVLRKLGFKLVPSIKQAP